MATVISLLPDVHQGIVTGAPVAWEAGKFHISAKGLIADEVLADPTQGPIAIRLQYSYDNGQSWSDGPIGNAWHGGVTNPLTNQIDVPGVGQGFSQSQTVPTHVRPCADLPGLISIGLSVTFS